MKQHLTALLILIFVSLLFFGKAIFSSGVIFGADFITFIYPLQDFTSRNLANGHIPLWNPYIYSGTSHIGSYQSAIFSFFQFLFLLFPIEKAFNIQIAIIFWGMAFFMYLLARDLEISFSGSLLSGICFSFSGAMILKLYTGHITPLTTIFYSPLVVFLLRKLLSAKKIIYLFLFSLSLSFQVFGGHPQFLYYSFLILFVFTLFFKNKTEKRGLFSNLCLFAVGIILFIFLSAIQLLPTAELAINAIRTRNPDITYYLNNSFKLKYLLMFLKPDIYGEFKNNSFKDEDSYLEVLPYFGLLPLILALVNIKIRKDRDFWCLTILIILALILASGRSLIFKLLFYYLPGISLFRSPSRALFILIFAISLLSGKGLDGLLSAIKKASTAKILSLLIILLSIMELFLFGGKYIEIINLKDYFWAEQAFDFLKKDSGTFRIATSFGGIQFLNYGMVKGLENINGGNDPLILHKYTIYFNLSEGRSPDTFRDSIIMTNFSPLISQLNVKYLILDRDREVKEEGLKLVYLDQVCKVYQILKYYPRVNIYKSINWIKPYQELSCLYLMKKDFEGIPFVEETAKDKYEFGDEGDISVLAPEFKYIAANQLQISLKGVKNSFVLIRDVYFPGWKAWIDDQEVRIHRANFLFKGIMVKEGKILKLKYEPFSFKLGMFLTILTLFFCSFFLTALSLKRMAIARNPF